MEEVPGKRKSYLNPSEEIVVHIWIIDDDPIVLDRYHGLLQSLGDVRRFTSLSACRVSAEDSTPALILLDMHLGEESGLTAIAHLKERYPRATIVAHTFDLSLALSAMREGADDFFHKGSNDEELVLRVKRWLEPISYPSAKHWGSVKLVGRTMKSVAERVPRIIASAVRSVYVFGPSGSGKEVVADLFEACSDKTPFVRINCGAISPQLLEAELFGHKRGAFTGATQDRKGLLASASGGWVFLDEVHCLTASAQAALLRALENQVIYPVGSDEPQKIRIKVLAASNLALEGLVQKGLFRADLFLRLCETEIRLTPLSQRKEEIEELIDFFCEQETGGPYRIEKEAKAILLQMDWDFGNVRALRNCIRAMTESAQQKRLTAAGIPKWLWQDRVQTQTAQAPRVESLSYEELCQQALLAYIEAWMRETDQPSVRQLAEMLKIPRTTLTRKLDAMNHTAAVRQLLGKAS